MLSEAGGSVEVGEGFADGGGQVAAVEVPLAGHAALGHVDRDATGGRPAEADDFGVGQFAGADLDGVDPPFTAFILVAVGEENGGGLEGAARIVQALVGRPVILFDAVHILSHDGRRGCFVVGRHDAVPLPWGESAGAVVAAAALAEVVALPEEVAVIGVGERAGLEHGSGARTAGADHDVHDQGVLIDPGAAAIGGDAVVHDVADLADDGAGDIHDVGLLAVDEGDAQIGGGAELSPRRRQPGRTIKISQRLANRG